MIIVKLVILVIFCEPADFLDSCDLYKSLKTVDSFESAGYGESGDS